jgi:hypothetical protein
LDLATFMYEQFIYPPLRRALLFDLDPGAAEQQQQQLSFFDSPPEDAAARRCYRLDAAQFDQCSSERRLRRAVSVFFDRSAVSGGTGPGAGPGAGADTDARITRRKPDSALMSPKPAGGGGEAEDRDRDGGWGAPAAARPWTESRLFDGMTSVVFGEVGVIYFAGCIVRYDIYLTQILLVIYV